MRRSHFVAIVLAVTALSGCSKKEDTLIETADQVSISAQQIDQDPLALLPSGAIGIIRTDAPAFFQSQFGQRLRLMAESRVPLPPSAQFDPARDLTMLYLGIYSMQGADFAGVATGRFNPAAIEQAADGTTVTPLGAPLVKTSYAKRTLYTSRNIGFAVLTEHTVLFGNETGIRRALDRMSEGRMKHDVPKAIDDVLSTPNAAMAAGFDFAGQPPVEAAMRSLPFLKGLKSARALGNFQPPGVNVAGTLSYPDAATAQTSVSELLRLHQQIRSYSFFMSLAGIQNPIQKLEARPEGNDAQFVLALEAAGVEWMLGKAAEQLGAPPATVQATTTPAFTTPTK